MNTYITLKNLPGGIKAGTIVKYNQVGGWGYHFESSRVSCPFDPTKDSEFFKPYVEAKFANGSMVYIKPIAAKKTNIPYSNHVIVISSDVSKSVVKYEVEYNRRRYSIEEKYLYMPDVYWFINSRGKLCSEILSDEHKNTFVCKFRYASQNAFPDKEKANDKLREIISNI